jgi:hypothetical protein
MSYVGANRVVANYNVMGPVKAALEAACRYLAYELGPQNIRVHAISPGPLKTRAASGIKDFELLLNQAAAESPLGQLVDIDDVGHACAYLATPWAHRITGGRSTSTGARTSSFEPGKNRFPTRTILVHNARLANHWSAPCPSSNRLLALSPQSSTRSFRTRPRAERAKLELIRLEGSQELETVRARLSAIVAEARSRDPWTSRARPSFLYVMYVLLLWALPMGLVAAVSPTTATHIASGMTAYLNALPEPLYALFGTGYLGYTAMRQWGKIRVSNGSRTWTYHSSAEPVAREPPRGETRLGRKHGTALDAR